MLDRVRQTDALPWAVGDFIKAVNRADRLAFRRCFAEDALVNDIRREFRGRSAILKWAEEEIFSAGIVLQAVGSEEHYGDYIVPMQLDGAFDRTGLPDPFILTFYFTLRGDDIARLIVLHNRPIG